MRRRHSWAARLRSGTRIRFYDRRLRLSDATGTRTAAAVAGGLLVAVSIATAPQALAGELGGVDVEKYCENVNSGPLLGTVSTSRDPNNAYSWRCEYHGGGLDPVHTTQVDMNLACREQYGQGAYAKPSDPHNANSWHCYR